MFKFLNNQVQYFPEETPEGEASDKNESAAESSLSAKLAELQQTVKGETAATGQLAKLVSDPNIRAYLEAQQQGKKAKFTIEEESTGKIIPEDDDSGKDEDVDLEELTRAQLVKYTAKQTVKALAPLIEKRFGDFEGKLKPIEAVVSKTQQNEVAASIEAARKKYPDWDKHREEMVKIHNEKGGSLDAEELYLLAKLRNGTLFKQTGTESERPDAFGTPEMKRPTGKYRGHAGMKKLLEEAVDETFDKLK